MKPHVTRRHFLIGGALGLVGGCSRSSDKPTLNIFVYAGNHEAIMREVFVPRMEAMHPVKVVLHPGWWDGIAKLKASPGRKAPFDLMITDATQGYPAVNEGLFRQMNFDNIPNIQKLAPSTLANRIARERYGVTYPDSVMTFAYRRDSLAKPPMSWGDLFRDELRGKIGLYSSFYMSLYTFACVMVALEGKAGTAHDRIERDWPGVMKFAIENRERVGIWWPNSADMILALSRRDCGAGNMHSPEYLTALREKPELAAFVPDEDRAMVQVFWSIPEGAEQVEWAEKAVDLIFSPEMQLELARRGMATSRPDVATQVSGEESQWSTLYPNTERQFQMLKYYPYEVYQRDWDAISKEWDQNVIKMHR
jgi:putative spermidine/putrescine transport system substrate-binding protein